MIREPNNPKKKPSNSKTVGIYFILMASMNTRRRQLNAEMADAGPAGPVVKAF